MVERWRWDGRELVHIGVCPAPRPRAAVEDVLDPLEQLHREPDDDQPAWAGAS
jgi:hypothetical protein